MPNAERPFPECNNLYNVVNLFNIAYSQYIANKTSENLQFLLDAHTQLTGVISCITLKRQESASLYDETTFTDLMSKYNGVITMRADLDRKLQELYNTQNSVANMNKSALDSTAYASILWSILATSILYYVFVKL